MRQLRMIRLERKSYDIKLPIGYSLQTYSEGRAADWSEACYELNGDRLLTVEQFEKLMLSDPLIIPQRIFFAVSPEGKGVSTATAQFNAELRTGTLHMVGTSGACKGLGLGYSVCAAAVNSLEEAGAEKITLLTDDFRIPAIKIYIKLGFMPLIFGGEEEGEPSMAERWSKVAAAVGRTSLDCYDSDKNEHTVIAASPLNS